MEKRRVWKITLNTLKMVLFWVLWLQFWIYCNFLKNMNFFVEQTSIFRCFLKVEKLNISTIYKSIIIIFSVNLPLVIIYKFWKKEIQLQPPWEPQEYRIGEV